MPQQAEANTSIEQRHRLVKGCDESAKNKEYSESNGQNANSEAGDDSTNSPLGS